jgi:hypothetical protein
MIPHTVPKWITATHATVPPTVCRGQFRATDPAVRAISQSSWSPLAPTAFLTPLLSNIHHLPTPSSIVYLQSSQLHLPEIEPWSPFNTHRAIAAAPQVRAG